MKSSANKTSARFLVEYAEAAWGSSVEKDVRRKYLLVCDIYIKARSYAILNKLFFWLTLFASLCVLVWPSLAIIAKELGHPIEFLSSAIVQTTVTGLAALSYAIYSHYKRGQMSFENLMRLVIYSPMDDADLVKHALAEFSRIDAGFAFSENLKTADKSSKLDE